MMQKHVKIYELGVRFRSDQENTCPQKHGGGGVVVVSVLFI